MSPKFPGLFRPAPGRRALEPSARPARQLTIGRPRPASPTLGPDAKLDWPSQAADFAFISGGESLTPKPYRFASSGTATSSAAGAATVSFGSPPSGYEWMIERIAVRGAGNVSAFVGGERATDLTDYTTSGAGDIADEASPIWVPPGQVFSVVFDSAGVGTLCSVRIQGLAVPI